MEWTGQRYADQPTVAADVYIAAPPAVIWPLVADIFLMPELSAELQEVAWLDGVTGPGLGHRFLGRNANPARGTWETVSTIVEFSPPRRFAWATGDPPWATWRFTLRPEGSGTVLEQWARLGPARSGLSRLIESMPEAEQKIVFVRLREWERGFTRNLAAIKARAENRHADQAAERSW
jgi:hypothetical protein